MSSGPRHPREKVLRLIEKIDAELKPKIEPFISSYTWAGSIRRMCETVGDLDLVLCLRSGIHHAGLTSALRPLAMGEKLLTVGPTKKSLRLRGSGIKLEIYCAHDRIDDMISPIPSDHGIILHTATGSYDWNLKICRVAANLGLRYSPFMGLIRASDHAVLPCETEAELFDHLRLEFVQPQHRK